MQLFRKAAISNTKRRVERSFSIENLEPRVVLSHAHPFLGTAGVGTIQGQVVHDLTGTGIKNIPIQLVNAHGRVVQTARTDSSGNYEFDVPRNGPFVVREAAGHGYAQVAPSFVSTPPQGKLGPGFGSSSWNYSFNTDVANGPVGPKGWRTIAPAGNLPFESPINIHGQPTDLSRVLSINYNDAVPKQAINNSHQIQVQFANTGNDSIQVGGQTFNLAQFHYHDPSETTVGGHRYALEEHFVNTSASGAQTVLAVFINRGAHNDALDPILNAALAGLTSPNSKTTIADPIHFAGLLPKSTKGWYYQGSLTTPPLSQALNWFVFSQPITMDAHQIKEYEQVARGSGFLPNARPTQPTDGRRVNRVDYDVNFQNQSVSNLNFVLNPISERARA